MKRIGEWLKKGCIYFIAFFVLLYVATAALVALAVALIGTALSLPWVFVKAWQVRRDTNEIMKTVQAEIQNAKFDTTAKTKSTTGDSGNA